MRFLLAILLFYSCQSGPGKADENIRPGDDDTMKPQPSQALVKENTFLDSISEKKELSIYQISRHLNIDSLYYTGIFSQAIFTGDTVFNFSHGIKGAIINYDDQRNCVSKFLFTFTSEGKNLDSKIIAMDCDHDESVGYSILSYKILSDSSFMSSEIYTPPGGKESDQQKRGNLWKVDADGRFVDITKKD
ncbi:MAG: hypothetical protein BGO54_21855 [Sphingobacteriales bacterium 46-32]|jgi:hypothetical protein|nr:MAG: hypothetical protein BGO54_21855 [Sphingobacteriales bacterium 46-32]